MLTVPNYVYILYFPLPVIYLFLHFSPFLFFFSFPSYLSLLFPFPFTCSLFSYPLPCSFFFPVPPLHFLVSLSPSFSAHLTFLPSLSSPSSSPVFPIHFFFYSTGNTWNPELCEFWPPPLSALVKWCHRRSAEVTRCHMRSTKVIWV